PMLPDWVLEKGDDEAKKILADRASLAKVLADMKQSHEVNRHRKTLAYAVISSCKQYPQYEGHNLEEVAQMAKAKALGLTPELLRDAEVVGRRSEVGIAPDPPPTTHDPLPTVSMDDQHRASIDI